MSDYNEKFIIDLIDNYASLRSGLPLFEDDDPEAPQFREMVKIKGEKRITKSVGRGPLESPIIHVVDFDRAADLIGDVKGAWYKFVNNFKEYLDTEYSKDSDITELEELYSRCGLNNYQIAMAYYIINGEWRTKSEEFKMATAAHKITNLLNHAYYRRKQIKLGEHDMTKTKNEQKSGLHLEIETETYDRFNEMVDEPTVRVVKELMEMVNGLGKKPWKRFKHIARIEDIQVSTVLTNCLLQWLIRIDEQVSFYGGTQQPDTFVVEFPNDFENNYRKAFRGEIELKECQRIIATKENFGVPLNRWEKGLLIENHMGKTWFESDEFKIAYAKQEAMREKLEKLQDGGKIETQTYWGGSPEKQKIIDKEFGKRSKTKK